MGRSPSFDIYDYAYANFICTILVATHVGFDAAHFESWIKNFETLPCFCVNFNKCLTYKCCKCPVPSVQFHRSSLYQSRNTSKGKLFEIVPVRTANRQHCTETCGSNPTLHYLKSNVSLPCGQTKSNAEQASKILEFDWFSKI